MAWFMWGVVLGWGSAATFYYSQTDNDKAANAAAILFVVLGIIAIVVSIQIGIASGVIENNSTPTPTSLGR